MGIGKRIREARERCGLTQKQLAKKIGVTSSAIANYENEISHPKETVLYALLDALQVDANFLFQDCVALEKKVVLSQEDNDFLQKLHALDRHGREVVNAVLLLEYRRSKEESTKRSSMPSNIPFQVSSQPASAGTGTYLGPDGFEEILVDPEQVAGADFGVPVRGDSMEPRFHNGDIILISMKQPVEVGDIALVTMDGCGYVKKIGQNELLSLNKKYAPIPMTEDVRVNGKVIGVLLAQNEALQQ